MEKALEEDEDSGVGVVAEGEGGGDVDSEYRGVVGGSVG